MSIPENRALAGPGVDKDDGELIRRALDRARTRQVDAGFEQALTRHRAERIGSERSDIRRRQAELGARRQGRADLPARHVHEPLQPLLAVAGRIFRHDGQQVHAVEAKSRDVEPM